MTFDYKSRRATLRVNTHQLNWQSCQIIKNNFLLLESEERDITEVEEARKGGKGGEREKGKIKLL